MGEIQRNEVPVSAPEFRIENNASQVRTVHEGGVVREIAVATYDVSGGDDGAVGAHGLGVYIPDNAVITKAWVDVVTTFTDGASDTATIAIHVQSADDVVAAIAINDGTNVWDAGQHGSKIGFPALGADAAHDTAVEVAALFTGTYLKTTDEREVTVTVATAALTAGKMHIYFEYVISS